MDADEPKIATDKHMREVMSGAGLALALRVAGAGLQFGLNIAIARLLGAAGAGVYFLALSVALFVSVLGRFGLENALLRFVSTAASLGDWGRVKGVFALGMKTALGASLGLSVLVMALAGPLAQWVFKEPGLEAPLRWMAGGVTGYSAMILIADALKGLKRITSSMLVFGILYPAIALLLIWPATQAFGATGATIAFAVSTGLAALIGWYIWWAVMRSHPEPAADFPPAELWKSSRPLWVMVVINSAVIPLIPMFLLGIWSTPEEIGMFGAATRIALLTTFFLSAVNPAIAPKFSELFARGDIATIGKVARRSAKITTLLTAPLFIALIFQGGLIMRLFGPEFAAGGTVLAILSVGQLVNTVTGSVGFLLMMTGHERDVRNASILGCAVLIVLCGLLIPGLGMVGAAIASASAIASINITSTFLVKRRLGIWVLPFLPVRQ